MHKTEEHQIACLYMNTRTRSVQKHSVLPTKTAFEMLFVSNQFVVINYEVAFELRFCL